MHIIAGERRGTQLFAPRGMDTRPTQAKVKESVFNIIQTYVPDARVLDLFAGSGSLALEALSRGAERADLVDRDYEAVACIRRNAEKLRYEDRVSVHRAEWKQALEKLRIGGSIFDLVFLDPPYRLTEIPECAAKLADGRMLARGAMLVCEHAADVPVMLDGRFELLKQRCYGDTEIHFYLFRGAVGALE